MPLQGVIQQDIIPSSKYTLVVPNLLADKIVFTSVKGLEREIPQIELPDRTVVTGGQPGPTELTVEVPLHHTMEILAMSTWFIEAQDPVVASYKRIGLMSYTSNTGDIVRAYSLIGVWCCSEKLPDAEMKSDTMQVAVFKLRCDSIVQVPVGRGVA